MNLLKSETSPYLRQHMDNPVEWLPWGPEAFEKARRENKPILLSIGYSACHWCHVMAHESFEDAKTADVMNRNFINIKLDREERPDLDLVYQAAMTLMNRGGGWPLTMFLLPDGAPFAGGTYFPPEARHGLPAFREFLNAVIERFHDKEKLSLSVKNIVESLNNINSPRQGLFINQKKLTDAAGHFLSLIDPAHGGIGTGQKFPCLGIMSFLWNNYIRTGNESCKFAVIHSLTQMCQGGIYDHLGGGFSRYTVDSEWLVPHFEKMLYDNAQFIALLSEVYKETKNPLFGERIEETVEWVLHDLSVRNMSHTAFAASLDADSEGKEGKFYTWTASEVDAVLGKDSETFKKAYDVTLGGNWEGVNILNRLKNPAFGSAEAEMQLKKLREKLKAARDKRVRPTLDNKVLSDSNGLTIAALVKAGFALNRREWVEAAENAFRFITSCMMDGEGRLNHAWCDGAARHEGVLDDYANMCDAALTLFDVTQNKDYLTQVKTWAGILDWDFRDTQKGGYFISPSYVTDLLIRPKPGCDSVSGPVGNGTMIGVLSRMHQLTGNRVYTERAKEIVETFAGELNNTVFPFSTILINSSFLLNPISVVILTGKNDASAFQDVLRGISLPGLATMVFPPDKILPKDHPAFGKTAVDGTTTAYVCFGQQCLPPVTTPETLKNLLLQARRQTAANDL